MVASLIIPTKNRLSLTKMAVASVQENLYFDEIIIVDDGSTFDIKEYYEIFSIIKIKVIKNYLSSGGLAARVCGAEIAKNDILVFLDSDDVLINDGISLLIKNMIDYKKYTLMYGNIEFDSNLSDWLKIEGNQFKIVLKNLSLCPFSGLAVRKSLMDWNALSLDLPAWQDDDFCIIASKNGLIRYIDITVAKNTLSEDSISKSKSKQLIGLLILIDKYKDLILKNFGLWGLLMWRLRQVCLFMEIISHDFITIKDSNILYYIFGKFLGKLSKLLKYFMRFYFDRIFV